LYVLLQEDLLDNTSGDVLSYMRGLLGIRPSVGKGARYKAFKKAWEQRMAGKEISVNLPFYLTRHDKLMFKFGVL